MPFGGSLYTPLDLMKAEESAAIEPAAPPPPVVRPCKHRLHRLDDQRGVRTRRARSGARKGRF